MKWIELWTNFKSMPLVLKFLTAHALGCFLFFIGSVVPHNSFSINGRAVTYAEWWNTGAGISASIIGVVLPIAGFLLLKRLPYARLVYLVGLLVAFLSPAVFMKPSEYSAAYYVLSLLFTMLIVGYLYISEPVKTYLTPNNGI